MRVSKVWSDVRNVIDKILHALDNNLTAEANFGATGAEENAVLTSQGPIRIPAWKTLGELVAADPSLKGPKGDPGDDGNDGVGTPGPQGPPGNASLANLVTADFGSGYELVLDDNGEVVYIE